MPRQGHTRRECHVTMKMEMEWCSGWHRSPKDFHNHQQLEESKKYFTQSHRGRAALPTPWIQNSGLPNQERISFSCVKPLSLFYFIFLQQPQKINREFVEHPPPAWQTLLSPVDRWEHWPQRGWAPTQYHTVQYHIWALCYSSDLCFVSWLSKATIPLVWEVHEGNYQKVIKYIFEA